MSDTIKDELASNPELSPIMDVDSRGNVICLGWVSPIYTFDLEVLGGLDEEKRREE